MKGRKPVQKELGEAWRYDTLGYTFAFSVIVFAAVGFLFDRLFKTIPIFTVVGTLVGAGLAFVWVYQKVKSDEARFKAERRPPRSEGDG